MNKVKQVGCIDGLYLGGNWIRTFSGKYIDVFNPSFGAIDITDIAHALAYTPRFRGHLGCFYSVAAHSIMCSLEFKEPEKIIEALLHDASEAYIADIPSPIKKKLKDYIELEDNLMKAIADKFGFLYPLSREVKQTDKQMLEYEWNKYVIGNEKFTATPEYVKELFLNIFYRNKLK